MDYDIKDISLAEKGRLRTIPLGTLSPGQFRYLTPEEIEKLTGKVQVT
jgi:16S rRNA U516 pseudouridylate synthase RsuA-like enzyme